MTGTQIQYFFAVFRHGNIAKAAESLHVSRPVVSRALSEIERSLELKLFDRTSGGILPTPQGIALYNMLDRFSQIYDYTIEKLKNPDYTNEPRDLRIGVPNAGGSWFYPVVYRPFREKYPDVTIKLEGIRAEDAAGLLINGRLDFAVAALPDDTMLLGSMYLYTTQWMLCAPKDSVIAAKMPLRECARLPVSILDTLPPPFYEHKNVVLSTKEPEMVRQSVASGYSHAILPMELCAHWDDVTLVPLEPPQTPQIHLFWNNAIPHGSAFDDFLGFIKKVDFEPLRQSWGGYGAQSNEPGCR